MFHIYRNLLIFSLRMGFHLHFRTSRSAGRPYPPTHAASKCRSRSSSTWYETLQFSGFGRKIHELNPVINHPSLGFLGFTTFSSIISICCCLNPWVSPCIPISPPLPPPSEGCAGSPHHAAPGDPGAIRQRSTYENSVTCRMSHAIQVSVCIYIYTHAHAIYIAYIYIYT